MNYKDVKGNKRLAALHEAATALVLVASGYGRAIVKIRVSETGIDLTHTYAAGRPPTDREIKTASALQMAGLVAVYDAQGKGLPDFYRLRLADAVEKCCYMDYFLLCRELDELQHGFTEYQLQQLATKGMKDASELYHRHKTAVTELAGRLEALHNGEALYTETIQAHFRGVGFFLGTKYDYSGLDTLFSSESPLEDTKIRVLENGLRLAALELKNIEDDRKRISIANSLQDFYDVLCLIEPAKAENVPTFGIADAAGTQRKGRQQTKPHASDNDTVQTELFDTEQHGKRTGILYRLRGLKVGESADFPPKNLNTIRQYCSGLKSAEGTVFYISTEADKITVTRTK